MSRDRTAAAELAAFLKARRAELVPSEVGLPETGSPRRVPGLRREEVAQLASVSVDYYTRIERGRIPPSASILPVLADALRLGDAERDYLYRLAGVISPRPRRRAAQKVRPAMRRLLAQLTESPALVLGRRMDVLAWNTLASALFTDFAQYPARHRNYVYLLFADPAMRDLHEQWEDAARTAVASLRMEAAADPGAPELAALVGELSVRFPEFRTWWAAHHVSAASYGVKNYRHPVVGPLTLDCDMWDSPDGGGQRLMLLTAEEGGRSHEALRILNSWAAAHAADVQDG
ncbi:helix-turn-helix domain-containing protein [Nonomuraea aridisoli]|uniref:Transcriptional regulator n=1 Tax=Nonomuraea aridisoli TaxID=2070368 RepID=A0A2W2F0Q0_9ACTN|nr:helix-turn-helix transcriptional regulator [Nonomuraea aridisoli]PZG18468.1 transcriptional regulator [Nonomuraea aridisoli]